jgi:uncharacterized membrane protein
LVSLSQAKILGEVGSLLVVLTAIPGAGGLLGIAGFVLLLIAVKEISDAVADRSIFNNMVISVGAAIIGVVVAVLLLIGTFISYFLASGYPGTYPGQNGVQPGDLAGLVGTAIGALAAVWVALIVSAVFVRRSYSSIASSLGVGMFRTAGLVWLIGAITSIIIIGFFIIFVAQILLIVAFFSMPSRTAELAPPPTPPPNPSTV